MTFIFDQPPAPNVMPEAKARGVMDGKLATAREQFESRNDPLGLFKRYARGRIRYFAMRQTMTVVGSVAVGWFGGSWLGILSFIFAVLGEGLDCLTLRSILRRGVVTAKDRRVATITAGFQALTITFCILVCWFSIPFYDGRVFAAVFLMAATINAGLVRRHFPEGARLRLTIYCVSWLGFLASQIVPAFGYEHNEAILFALALLILGYTSVMFIRTVEKGKGERLRFERALLAEQEALESSRAALAEEVRRAERLALVARHANDSVIFTGADGRIEWVNMAFSRITGHAFGDVVGRTPGEVLNGPNTIQTTLDLLESARREGRPCVLEIENRTKEGHPLWMEVSMTPILRPDGNPEVYIAVERDITQAKAHAAELAAAQKAAEAAAEAKSAFLATMSHEIRTPMNGVIGLAELLGETRLDPQQSQYVRTIVESAHALLTIINDVLDLSKLQADKGELQAEAFSVADCVMSAIDLLRPTAQKKGIDLGAKVPKDFPRHMGDAGRLRQILLNLIGNAVKFTGKGQVTVLVDLFPGQPRDTLRIAIADTGIGIARNRMAYVFDSFAQADASISRKFGGTGLGLTISKLLAQQMGGDIEVSSEIGKGSVFKITLRLPAAPLDVETKSPVGDVVVPHTALRVLLAEDNRTNMLIARKLLEKSVAALFEVTNGKKAVDHYASDPPELVLMDISMPEMDGMMATRAIRTHEASAGLPRCPIYALTAYDAPEEVHACLDAGMDGVLTKPLVRRELYDLIASIASGKVH